MTAVPWLSLSWLGLFLGGGMMPPHLSFPPLPPDPKLAAVAPDECLFYMNWAGTAEPDPDSPNRTERLLAEPAVRELFDQVERQITLAFRRQVGRGAEGAIVGQTVPMLVEGPADQARGALRHRMAHPTARRREAGRH